jgi:hypothetical protein
VHLRLHSAHRRCQVCAAVLLRENVRRMLHPPPAPSPITALCRCVERGYVTRIMQGGSLCIMVPRFGLETSLKLPDSKMFSFVPSEMKLTHKLSSLE